MGASKNNRVIGMIIIMAAVLIILTACSREAQEGYQAREDKVPGITVAVTIVPEATFVKEVGGELVDVLTLIPPGYSPANYAPSPGELTGMEKASIYFSIGVPADLATILPRVTSLYPEIRVVKLHEETAAVYPEREFKPGSRDPHIWLSPKRVSLMVEIIARELSEIDPDNGGFYLKNARQYQARLGELDREIRDKLRDIEQRVFITYHPSFGYIADEYQLEMVAVEEEGKEAAARHLGEIIDRARREGIKTVFYQAEIDSRQSRAIAGEIGGEAVQLAPLAADYLENMRRTVDLIIGSRKTNDRTGD